ncbi:hypothetical protein [Variovorax sp. JS1663]|uniref:hypothetical protein n=1 Tax=Variovorax sp. JS1663 TaxID=1851577 RepID=UPI000B3492BE|nr:hypothetical protein [Variovorax sp. JS1663]OUM00327.1 hypothetical protein A8M77_21850 [Variovorax sp. JS1663]
MKDVSGEALCPSAPAAPGAALIGVVGADARVVRLITPLTIDASFVAAAHRDGAAPERRFRFASPCQEGRCAHWAGEQCGLIGQLQHAAAGMVEQEEEGTGSLPPCPIRARCRWWQQRGRDACAVCALVVTDQRPVP